MISRSLPLIRLALYLLIFGVCAAVVGREFFYLLAGETTTGTILVVGGYKSKGGRTSGYFADYEYFDMDGQQHRGRADSFSFSLDGTMRPTDQPGDPVEVQYLRHAPQTSRLPSSPIGGLCFGSIALLAAVVFVAEVAVRLRRKSREADGDG